MLNDDPGALAIQQDRILGHCFDYDRLDAVEKDVLSLLSWVPRLDSGLLRAASERPGACAPGPCHAARVCALRSTLSQAGVAALRRRTMPRPRRPMPNSAMLAGSGTAT